MVTVRVYEPCVWCCGVGVCYSMPSRPICAFCKGTGKGTLRELREENDPRSASFKAAIEVLERFLYPPDLMVVDPPLRSPETIDPIDTVKTWIDEQLHREPIAPERPKPNNFLGRPVSEWRDIEVWLLSHAPSFKGTLVELAERVVDFMSKLHADKPEAFVKLPRDPLTGTSKKIPIR